MDSGNAITLALLLAIPIGVLLLLLRPTDRARGAPRRDGPLGSVAGGLALAGWASYVGPQWAQPFVMVGVVIAGLGFLWHVARTVRRLNRAQF